MGARRERIDHDHARGVVVRSLKTSLLQQGKTQTEPGFDVVSVFDEQVTKDLFGFRVIALLYRSITFVVSLLVGETGCNVGRTGERKTKHEGGHTEGRRPEKTPIGITLHD